ncbi:MAG: hypothetical protein Q9223_005932 [Gallowayella weberi]
MLSFKLLLAALTAGLVVAQNSTTGSSGNTDNTIFNVNEIDRTQRAFTKENRCIAVSLPLPLPAYFAPKPFSTRYLLTTYKDPISYVCQCSNGTSPDLAAYANTFVSDTCQARFKACRDQNPGSDLCVKCGTLKADDVPKSTSSSSAASTAAATSSGTGGGATGAAGPSQKNAAEPMIGGMEMVKGAVGIVAAMGLVL